MSDQEDQEVQQVQDAQNVVADGVRPRRHTALRVMLGCLLVAGMAYGWFAMARQKTSKEMEAIAAVRQAGGRVYLDYQWEEGELRLDAQPPEAAWLRALLGAETFDHAIAVDLQDASSVAKLLKWLPLMPELKALNAEGTALNDAALARIGRLLGLTHLDLSSTSITDQGVAHLKHLATLTTLSLAQTEVSDASVTVLGQLRNLRRLDLTGTRISDRAYQQLTGMLPKCRIDF